MGDPPGFLHSSNPQANDGTIALFPEFKIDMAWFNAFHPAFNSKVYFDKCAKPTVTNLYVDACLTGVIGV